MKRKLSTSLFAAIMLLGMGILATGCGPDNTLTRLEVEQMIEANNQKLEFTNWKIININVAKDTWTWNDQAAQYEAVANIPEMTKFIYENGAALAYVFIGEQGKNELQKPLPYVNTYSVTDDAGNPVTFTETISCDFQLGNPSTVAFYIKASDLARDFDAPQNYNFRVVLVW